MLFNRICVTLLAVVGVAIAGSQPEEKQVKRANQANQTLKSQLSALKSLYGTPTLKSKPFQTPLPGLAQPDMKVVQAIITGVPPSVLGELVVPKSRQSLAAEFKAGHTPAWYQDLPADAKEYIRELKTQTKNGGITATTTYQTTTGPNAVKTTSSDFAPQATANAVNAAGVAGLISFLGLVIAL